jgi:hypothetical protein
MRMNSILTFDPMPLVPGCQCSPANCKIPLLHQQRDDLRSSRQGRANSQRPQVSILGSKSSKKVATVRGRTQPKLEKEPRLVPSWRRCYFVGGLNV